MKSKAVFLFLFCCLAFQLRAQDSLSVETEQRVLVKNSPETAKPYNPLAPAKAAFYSAVLPGLGQAYNGKYWKIPLVYAGLGTGVYFYISNNKQYHRYRDAYKSRLAGQTDDEFQGLLSDESLIEAQKHFQRNKELSLLLTTLVYILNILDANVDAHLQQFNVSEDLSFRPNMNYDQFTGDNSVGLSLDFRF